jgi:hypothetical protein
MPFISLLKYVWDGDYFLSERCIGFMTKNGEHAQRPGCRRKPTETRHCRQHWPKRPHRSLSRAMSRRSCSGCLWRTPTSEAMVKMSAVKARPLTPTSWPPTHRRSQRPASLWKRTIGYKRLSPSLVFSVAWRTKIFCSRRSNC